MIRRRGEEDPRRRRSRGRIAGDAGPETSAPSAAFGGDAGLETGAPNAAPTRWRRSLQLIAVLLAVWFVASLGLGVLFAAPLNRIWAGGFPLGFWFAQQGSILIFVLLLIANAVLMDRIERDD